MAKKLCKSNRNRMIAGVCSGVADYFNIDVTIVRLIWIAAVLLKGAGVLLYVIACIVMPQSDDFMYSEDDVENMKSANCEEEKKSFHKKEEKSDSDEAIHSNEEFDSFFKK